MPNNPEGRPFFYPTKVLTILFDLFKTPVIVTTPYATMALQKIVYNDAPIEIERLSSQSVLAKGLPTHFSSVLLLKSRQGSLFSTGSPDSRRARGHRGHPQRPTKRPWQKRNESLVAQEVWGNIERKPWLKLFLFFAHE